VKSDIVVGGTESLDYVIIHESLVQRVKRPQSFPDSPPIERWALDLAGRVARTISSDGVGVDHGYRRAARMVDCRKHRMVLKLEMVVVDESCHVLFGGDSLFQIGFRICYTLPAVSLNYHLALGCQHSPGL
jgi:hypothetical protein